MNTLFDLIGSLAGICFLTIVLIITVFFVYLCTFFSKKNLKTRKYRSFSIVLLVLGCLVLFSTGISYIDNLSSKVDSSSSIVADGFTIENYKIKLNVNENNVIDVTEIVTVNFYESGHHGIYKIVPSWVEYTGKDGITISRESKVENLQAINSEYSLDTFNGKDRISIGSSNYTLSTGYKTYTITYQYDMGNDPYDNIDEFIFHAFGDYWGTTINNASLEVTMPKTFDESSIKFFSDKYRNNDITSYVDYYTVGNTLYAQLSSSYELKKSLTIDIELPEGYFIDSNNNYGSLSLVACLLIILFTIITFIKWLKHGKDFDKISETVEFYPPENYDSASIGYIYKKDSGKKLAISVIIQLACKGFIRIDSSDDKKVQTITNLCPINVNKAINRTISVVKLKDASKAKYKTILDEYFGDDETNKVIDTDFDDFYEKTKSLVDMGYIKIEKDTINNYTKDALDNISSQLKDKVFKDKPIMTSNERLVFNKLFANSDVNILSEDRKFYTVFAELTENLQKEFDDKINDILSYKNMAIACILFFISSVYFLFAFVMFEDLNPKFKILYLFAFISIIITFILVILMKRKNTYGEQITAKIKGFKNYLETVEKSKIEALANVNPNYFYELLPYAYVLGVSKAWIENFGNIPIPQSDMGNFDYCNMISFNDLSNSVYYPSSSSSGSGCSSCGGGCSSCGGGGSW